MTHPEVIRSCLPPYTPNLVGEVVRIDFPLFVPDAMHNAKVIAHHVNENVAVLETDTFQQPHWAIPPRGDLAGAHEIACLGFLEDYHDGLWLKGNADGVVARGMIQFTPKNELVLGGGYLGAPVWDVDDEHVLGLVGGTGQKYRVASVIPWNRMPACPTPAEHQYWCLISYTAKQGREMDNYANTFHEKLSLALHQRGHHIRIALAKYGQPSCSAIEDDYWSVLSNSAALLILLSPTYFDDVKCRQHLALRLSRQQPVIPIVLRNSEYPGPLKDIIRGLSSDNRYPFEFLSLSGTVGANADDIQKIDKLADYLTQLLLEESPSPEENLVTSIFNELTVGKQSLPWTSP